MPKRLRRAFSNFRLGDDDELSLIGSNCNFDWLKLEVVSTVAVSKIKQFLHK